MSDLFWLTVAQIARLEPFFPKPHALPGRRCLQRREGGRTKGGMNTKLDAICDSQGRPLNLFVTAGQLLGDANIACQPAGQ